VTSPNRSRREFDRYLLCGILAAVAAKRHGASWRFQTRLKSEETWTYLDALPLEDLQYVREVLWNKYQRRRVPYEQVLEIDAMISNAPENP
jgi:hypothetical protein